MQEKVLEKLGLPSVLSCTLPASPSSVSMHCFSVSVASDTRMLYYTNGRWNDSMSAWCSLHSTRYFACYTKYLIMTTWSTCFLLLSEPFLSEGTWLYVFQIIILVILRSFSMVKMSLLKQTVSPALRRFNAYCSLVGLRFWRSQKNGLFQQHRIGRLCPINTCSLILREMNTIEDAKLNINHLQPLRKMFASFGKNHRHSLVKLKTSGCTSMEPSDLNIFLYSYCVHGPI